MKTAVFASLIAGAAAFAPAKTVQSSTALTAAFGEEVRACVCVCVLACVCAGQSLETSCHGDLI
jgi:hypothetical protein